jgi:hypothetical protein
MENVHYDICFVVQQDNVATDENIITIGWWRRQAPFQFFWAGLDAFLEPWRQRSPTHKLLFQSRGQLVFSSKARGEMAFILVIPTARSFLLVVLVIVFGLLVVIFTVMLIVTFAMSVAIALSLGDRGISA